MNQPDLFDPPHVALMKQARDLREGIAETITKANQLERLAMESCPHDDTKIVESYFSGSYYDNASSTYTTVCNFCGTILKEEVERHSYYG